MRNVERPERDGSPRTNPRETTLALGSLAAIALVVVAVFGRAIPAPFIFDDRTAILENPSIVRLWPPIGDAERRGPLNPPPLAPTARRPLVNLTFAVDHHLHGFRPAGYRAVNFVLHALSAALLAAIVRRTLRLPYFAGTLDRVAWPLSLAVALVWAVHPLTTESVVYVTQRTELMGAFFSLAVLWAAVRHWTASSERARTAWLVPAGLACLAGVASKEIVVFAPIIVWLYERTFLVDSFRATRRSWPLYAALMLGWVLFVVLSTSGFTGRTDERHDVAPLVWWMTQTKVLFLYLKLALWPWPLSIHYAPTYLETIGVAWPWIAAAVALAVAVAVVVRRRPAAAFVVVAIAAILVPTFVVPLPKMVAAERRMYLPLAGLVSLALVGGYRLLAARRPVASDGALAAGTSALVLVLSVVTVVRLGAYESAVTIWQDAVRRQPDDPMAHYNLAVALMEGGRPPAETMPYFEQALRLDAEYTHALDNLGMVLNRLGRPQDAIVQLERALAIDPGDAVAHNNLGIALTSLGRSAEAIAHLERALALEPDQPKSKVHTNLGNALLAMGDADAALAHLADAVRLDGEDSDAHFNLGNALLKTGRPADAIPHLGRALRLAPGSPETYNSLASAELQAGRTEDAVAHYRAALALRPDDPGIHSNLGTALLVLGRREEAIAEFERALRLNPDHANARANLRTLTSQAPPTNAP